MRSLLTVALVVSLLAVSPVAAGNSSTPNATATPASQQPGPPTIHAVYPDPAAGGDRGEFVVLDVPARTELGRYALGDGHSTVELPNGTTESRVAVTTDPRLVRNLTDTPVRGVNGSLELANGGDQVSLRRGNTTLQTVRYAETTEGELGVVNGSTIHWQPLGATDRPVVTGGPADVRAFTLPDAPAAPLRAIRRADERVFLAGYTLTSARVADALLAAQRRGATVRVLLEGDPVGSRTTAEAQTLDRLSEAGVDVRLVAGPHARYRYHHAKYAIADDRAVVLTENWKPAGTGGNSSRGWGVETGQPRIVDGLAETFRADVGWRDAVRWSTHRAGRRFERGEPATESYPGRFDPERVPVNRTALLVTPDNAQRDLVATLDGATTSIDVVQPTVGGWDEPLLRALRRAASRGVRVRLLLSSAWYVREENQRTVTRFEEWAKRADAPLEARLADPGGRYGKIHAKGAVVDGDQVILGSLNWNEQAATSNREVVLRLDGRAAGDYYGRVFDADWRGGRPTLPVGPAAAVLGVLAVGGLAARHVEFEGENA